MQVFLKCYAGDESKWPPDPKGPTSIPSRPGRRGICFRVAEHYRHKRRYPDCVLPGRLGACSCPACVDVFVLIDSVFSLIRHFTSCSWLQTPECCHHHTAMTLVE